MIYKPITINDVSSPIENTRKSFLDEENQKIKGKKGFVFSNYITERERLQELMKEKSHERQVSNQPGVRNNIDEKILLGLVQQPQMRYKPRTDIERIIDTLASNNLIFGQERKILNNQLKNMNIGVPFLITAESLSNPLLRNTIQGKNAYINTGDIDNTRSFEKYQDTMTLQNNNLATDVSKNKSSASNDFFTVKKNAILEAREKAKKRTNNKDAKKILKHLHVKTYFKASTSLIFDKNLNIPPQYQNIIQSYNNLKSSGMVNGNIKTYAKNIAKQKQITDLIKPQYKEDMFFPASQNNFYKQDNQEVDFKLNYNPLIKFEENMVDYTKLRKAKHIFMKDENAEEGEKKVSKYPGLVKRLIKNKVKKGASFKMFNTNEINAGDDPTKKEEEKVVIDKETINKDEMDKIAKRILYKCNYFHKKNKNNDTRHEKRKGKTMITNGMTVKEFEREYGLEFVNFNRNIKTKPKFLNV